MSLNSERSGVADGINRLPGQADDARLNACIAWLDTLSARVELADLASYSIAPASADASFRRYFRITTGAGRSFIVMDAPPPQENCRPFVRIATMMRAAGLNAPDVHAQDLDNGFLLLTDLGRHTYLDVLDADNVDSLMRAATDSLIRWQCATQAGELPPYDEAVLRREIALFPDWYVSRHLRTELTLAQRETMEAVFSRVVQSNLAQKTVYVHRDFMPRNLMVSDESQGGLPGVLDFQDALIGPIGYDIACLWRDAFVSWEEERVLDGTVRYWEKAKKAGLPVPTDFGDFYRDVEWMALQRHLKVLGIFARINYRDGKPRYLTDTPRFVRYVRDTCRRYDALAPLLHLFDELHIGEATQYAVTF